MHVTRLQKWASMADEAAVIVDENKILFMEP